MAGESADEERGAAFATESLEKWTPRFLTNGIDANDLERIEDEIEGWADWCYEFSAVGDGHVELAEEALEQGYTESAAEHFTSASMYYHFGSHVWHEDEEYRDEVHMRAVESFSRGGELLDPPVQRLEAPYDGFAVPGNLRVPDAGPDGTSGDSPLVFLIPGLDSIKEELSAFDSYFNQRGLATLAIDGAAQGETWYNMGMSPDYPKLVSAVVDRVIELDPTGVDTSRLGVFGVSLGGFYAPFAAAHESRFDACVGISGPFTVGPITSRGSDLVKEQFEWCCKVDTMLEVDEITEQMSLRDCIDDLTMPSLMITGAQDHIIAPEQTRRIAERASDGEFIIYEEGNHVCNNIPYKYKPLSADWMRDQIARTTH